MKIQKVKIENFRSIHSAEVTIDDLTVFVGRNGAGKSTLLYAIDSFYTLNHQYTLNDYFNHNGELTILIEITFSSLLPAELNAFGKYVQNNQLVVSKKINSGGARYYGSTLQLPQFSPLRSMGARDKRAALVRLVEDGLDFGDIPRASEDVDNAMIAYEQRHLDQCQLIQMENQFLGPRNIGAGSLDNCSKFVLIPAVKEASNEIGKRGAINQLLESIVISSINTRQDFQEFKQHFTERVSQLYSSDNLPELRELGSQISEKLNQYSPGSNLNIEFGAITTPNMPLPDPLVTISEDGFHVPIDYCGHGLQRALILALLEQLSMLRAQDQTEELNQTLILGIEEPELYLHPSRSRYFAKLLRSMTSAHEIPNSVQVISVTHSPYFVDVANFDAIRMCRKTLVEDELPKATHFLKYTRLEAVTRLANIHGRNPEDFSVLSFVARAAPVLNSMVNEGLFADVTVVVEGESDAAALWTLQELMQKRWSEKHITVVPVGGKNNIDRAVIAFQGFGIPTFYLFDGDASRNESARMNRALLALGNFVPVDYPPTQQNINCGVFENNIEAYLHSVVGDAYNRLRTAAAQIYEFDELSKAMKNSEVMAEFVKLAMLENFRFEFLEAIIETITSKS